jgi:hypothetical protein
MIRLVLLLATVLALLACSHRPRDGIDGLGLSRGVAHVLDGD